MNFFFSFDKPKEMMMTMDSVMTAGRHIHTKMMDMSSRLRRWRRKKNLSLKKLLRRDIFIFECLSKSIM
jgi:hypothetical protein